MAAWHPETAPGTGHDVMMHTAESERAATRSPGVRLCHVISADLWAGAAVQVYQTVSDLHNREVDVAVVVFNDGVFARRVEAEQIAWRLFDEKRLTAVQITRRLAKFIAQTDPHCLHVHAHKEHILAAAACALANRNDIPILRTIHGQGHVPSDLRASRRFKNRVIDRLEQFLLPRAVLIAVSRDIEALLRHTYPNTRVELVPNGIRLPDVAMSRKDVRARWGVPQDAFWVGCVARLEPVKNLPCLVQAAVVLSETVSNLRVSIFGTGSQQAALQDLICALGAERIVALHGFDDRMTETTSAFDCFVLSSLHEGLPMSLLEAMALGVPPVCSRVGGMTELITPGETGLLFESNDHIDLARCLRWVRESKEAALRMGLAAQKLVRESYSIDVTNAALMKVYESVMLGSRSSE
jgi:glycosyltransferase involved in cell wall biosynthesis